MLGNLVSAIAIAAAITAGLMVGGVVLVYFIGEAIKAQARKKEKRYFAPIPRPGSFSFSALEGEVDMIIENVSGWHLVPQDSLDGELCFCTGNDREVTDSPLNEFLREKLGVVWIGLYHTIKIIKGWKWTEFKQTVDAEGKPVFEIVPREEDVQEFFFQFQYPVTIENIEIAENIRVRVEVVFIVLHLFPARAFFLNKDPIAVFNAMTQGLIRRFIRNMNFDGVKGLNAERDAGDQSLWQEIDRLNGLQLDPTTGQPNYATASPHGLFDKLGYYITRAEITQVAGVGDAAKAIEAAGVARLTNEGKVAEEERLAEARRKKAQGIADAMNIEREARKQWVNETIVGPSGGPGPHVAQVLTAEQIANSKIVALGGQSLIQIPPPEKEKEKKD